MHPFDELEAKSDRFLEKLCELTHADLNSEAAIYEVTDAAGLNRIETDSIFQYLNEEERIKPTALSLVSITSKGLRRLKEVKEGGSAPGSSPSVIYNISGPNARVNINSHDASVNIVNVTADNFFEELKKTIQHTIPDGRQKSDLLQCVEELKRAQSLPVVFQYYQQFMSLAADHLAVFQPFLPALTQMLFGS